MIIETGRNPSYRGPFQQDLRPVLRASVNHNNLSAFKGRRANRLDDLFDGVLFVITENNDCNFHLLGKARGASA
jgi:hypothetical protein